MASSSEIVTIKSRRYIVEWHKHLTAEGAPGFVVKTEAGNPVRSKHVRAMAIAESNRRAERDGQN